MVNRYNAGDWRQYYFDVKDNSIDTAAINISWQDQDTNFSAFMLDPKGRIIQSNVPSGAFGQLLDWPTSDWLGTTTFSEGGGFYPVKNKDATSTLLYAPINQTGTYTLLLHSTLFGGQSTTEPFTVVAQFSSLEVDDESPKITLPTSKFVNAIPIPTIIDDRIISIKYYLDGMETVPEDLALASEGSHTITIDAYDKMGNTSTQSYSVIVDKTMPEILVTDSDLFSGILQLDFVIKDANPNKTFVLLPNGTRIENQTSINFDTTQLNNGKHEIIISAMDMANNENKKTISLEIGSITKPIQNTSKFDYNLVLLIIAGVFAIGITTFIILGNKSHKSLKR
jgi:hypothetical protein